MPVVAECDGAKYIVGPGLDHVLEPGAKLVILDEYYADVYSDYIFAGYDVVQSSIAYDYADLVGAYTAALLIEDGAVVVCGEDPLACTLALASRKILAGGGWYHSLREAWHCISRLYPSRSSLTVPGESAAALRAVERIGRLLGSRSHLLVSLALNYEYGRGSRFYGELVTWLNELLVDDETFMAGLLIFLVESNHGRPWEILRYRLEAVGEANLLAAFGDIVESALSILKSYADGRLEGEAGRLAYVAALEPGAGKVIHVGFNASRPIIYCPGEPQGGPSRGCVEAVKRASEIAKRAGLEGWERPRIQVSRPSSLTLT